MPDSPAPSLFLGELEQVATGAIWAEGRCGSPNAAR